MKEEFLHSFTPFAAVTPFYISLAGVTYPDPNYRIEAQKRDLTVIEYVMDGVGYALVDGEYRRVEADMIYLFNKGEHHDYFADKKNPFTKIFLNISGTLAKELPSLYGIGNSHIFVNKELRPVFRRIPKILQSSRNEEQMQIELQLVLIEILTKLSYHQNEQNTDGEAAILKNHIDSNIDRLIPNSELAKVIFRSVDYCQKLFLKEFGTTPYRYQLDRKIMVAKNLLTNTNTPISTIGASLGYVDSHYFSNIFKAKVGCSPRAYRKNKTV